MHNIRLAQQLSEANKRIAELEGQLNKAYGRITELECNVAQLATAWDQGNRALKFIDENPYRAIALKGGS